METPFERPSRSFDQLLPQADAQRESCNDQDEKHQVFTTHMDNKVSVPPGENKGILQFRSSCCKEEMG
jgi:hypothetical protein